MRCSAIPIRTGFRKHGESSAPVSIELRKLLFDSTPLLHRVMQKPRFHPLNDKGSLKGDKHKIESTLSIELANRMGQLVGAAASRKWQLTICPLQGLAFSTNKRKWTAYPMFNDKAVPIPLGKWLRQKLFFVDDRAYSLIDTLRFLANKEGAHVDTVNDVQMRDMERVHFGNTTYYHIVGILTASYVLGQYQASQQANRHEWERFSVGRGHSVESALTFISAEFAGPGIDPIGLPNVAYGTGIQLPSPGEPWNPTEVVESTIVYS